MDRSERERLALTLSASPRWLRTTTLVTLAVLNPVWKVVRVLILLQAVGGAVGIIIGASTLNAKLAVGGVGQLLLAGLVLAISPGSSENVVEATGPGGAFVIRAQRARRWRIVRGWARVAALLRDDRGWIVKVRRRKDDPFGAVLLVQVVATQADATASQEQIRRQIRDGERFETTARPD